MTNKQKIAITNLIRAAENPKRYGIDSKNKEEQNAAIVRAFKTLFDVDGAGVITDLNEETVEELYVLKERSTIDFL